MLTAVHMVLYPRSPGDRGAGPSDLGQNPAGYHLTSLVIQAVNAVLVYALALRLLVLASPRSLTTIAWPSPRAAALPALRPSSAARRIRGLGHRAPRCVSGCLASPRSSPSDRGATGGTPRAGPIGRLAARRAPSSSPPSPSPSCGSTGGAAGPRLLSACDVSRGGHSSPSSWRDPFGRWRPPPRRGTMLAIAFSGAFWRRWRRRASRSGWR